MSERSRAADADLGDDPASGASLRPDSVLVGHRFSIRGWIVKRGLPYVIIQLPMLAFLVGYAWGWTSFANATILTLYVAVILLPLWALWRIHQSADASEPVHHLGRYAIYALVPFAAYDLARMPTYYLLDAAYWDRWYDFGTRLTGITTDWATLVVGTSVHMVQGYVLGLGFYVLFERHSLRNALVYLFVILSLIYSWTFTAFVNTSPTTAFFLFNVWWAHLWMAIAAWATPIIYMRLWPRIQSRAGRAVCLATASIVWTTPFAFAFWQASASTI